jgi:hypothetical protein
VKSVIDSMLRRNDLNNLIWLKGAPIILIGSCEDTQFEEHLQEGPCPVLRDAITGLLKGLDADADFGGQAIMAI